MTTPPRMRNFVTIGLCLLSAAAIGQTTATDSVKREAIIEYVTDDNNVMFSAVTPQLVQIQGAPQAFYTYYWEFGDGHYSTDPKPKHNYKKEGEYKVQLWTTNNYDNGKPPPSRPKKVAVKKIAHLDTEEKRDNLDEHSGFRVQTNRAPVPDEEMVVIVSYKNPFDYPSNGKLYLFYNEQRFKADNFSRSEVRTHYGEKEVLEHTNIAAVSVFERPDQLWASADGTVRFASNFITEDTLLNITLDESKQYFRDVHMLEFDNMAPGEERNVFYTLRTTPEMLKDTSAIIKIRGVYVPDKSKNAHKVKEVEMEIVTSHDPNKMSISDTRLNYRFFQNKDLQFKVRFQNNGEGPARSIKLNVDISEMFDKKTLKVVDMYPKCPICPDSLDVSYSCLDTIFTDDQITFHFKNIYLPGSNQKNVEDYDSTKGFVKYTLRFNKKVPKRNSVSRTAIIFDKNEPVLTNYSHTRFKPGLSIGIKAGYNIFTGAAGLDNYFIGATISPFKPYKGYLQAELMVNPQSHTEQSGFEEMTPILGTDRFDLHVVTQRQAYKNMVIQIVPASYRYNLNKFLGIGGGIQASMNLSEKIQTDTKHEYFLYVPAQNFREPRKDLDSVTSESSINRFNNLNVGLFGDVVVGSSRIGPAVGARYVYFMNAPHQQWQFYILWKF
jgi:hypothetical protein